MESFFFLKSLKFKKVIFILNRLKQQWKILKSVRFFGNAVYQALFLE